MFHAYVIKNNIKGKIYIGQTSDLENRLKRHNGLLKNKGLWILAYSEKYDTRQEAMKREKWLKSGVGREYIKSILKKF